MGQGVIVFRVSPVDVAYAGEMCITGFSEGPERCTSGTWVRPRGNPFLAYLAPPFSMSRNYKLSTTQLYSTLRMFSSYSVVEYVCLLLYRNIA